jgi:hypothetical protein
MVARTTISISFYSLNSEPRSCEIIEAMKYINHSTGRCHIARNSGSFILDGLPPSMREKLVNDTIRHNYSYP